MKIGEAARKVGLPIKTVRHYADIGLVRPADIRASGYRDYGEPELRRLRMVARARASGFSIEECRQLMRLIDDPLAADDDAFAMAVAKREALDQQLAELLSLRATLDQLITTREKAGPPPRSGQPGLFG
ncbi:MAG: MerR family transcriptional regulator [Neomegalonema sp.]|nr:MerR family transcriptional regulator [Neomegalonema sp.]